MSKIKILGMVSILVLFGILVGPVNVGACENCRWTGGGSIISAEGLRVTHGFEIHCNVNQHPNNIQVNWEGNHFHIKDLEYVYCNNYPELDPEHPEAPCDWVTGWGYGKLNGVKGAQINFIFTDDGEPGTHDYAWIRIKDPSGVEVLNIDGFLTFGNHQAHRLTGKYAP